MRLGISNIAWDVAEDPEVAALLRRHGVDAIDIAPGKYFPEIHGVAAAKVVAVREWWAERGIEITGMQALLFGTSGLNVFGAPDVQQTLLDHLDAVCRIGALLGAPRLVFGAPVSRDRGSLSDAAADETAIAFFRRLGGVAAAHGVWICIEPVPAAYGCNFMTRTSEAASVVERLSHAAIRLQLDTGTMSANAEDPMDTIAKYAPLIGHLHASEPGLATLGDGTTDHAMAGRVMEKILPGRVVSIEMIASRNEPHAVAISRALGIADRAYRAGGAV